MADPTPFANYYSQRVGKWRGTLHVEFTSWSGFWAAPMSLLDRFRNLGTFLSARLIGPATMLTTVRYPWQGNPREIFHTTRIVKWGMTLMWSSETFALLPDNDRAFRVSGTLFMVPLPGAGSDYGDSSGEIVDDAGNAANYHFRWMGQMLEQRTAGLDGRLALHQMNPWSRNMTVLERYSLTPD